jgi:hypothetical protein
VAVLAVVWDVLASTLLEPPDGRAIANIDLNLEVVPPDVHLAAGLLAEIVGPVTLHLLKAAGAETSGHFSMVLTRHRGPVVNQGLVAVGVVDVSERGVDRVVEITCSHSPTSYQL